MAKYGFCHGWMLNGNYCEVTCKKRENCLYFDIDFYRHHGNHLEDFEEMFPFEPCKFYMPRKEEKPKLAESDDIFALK